METIFTSEQIKAQDTINPIIDSTNDAAQLRLENIFAQLKINRCEFTVNEKSVAVCYNTGHTMHEFMRQCYEVGNVYLKSGIEVMAHYC